MNQQRYHETVGESVIVKPRVVLSQENLEMTPVVYGAASHSVYGVQDKLNLAHEMYVLVNDIIPAVSGQEPCFRS